MQLTATAISYLHICHRKLWLFARNIQLEHTSDAVYEGKVIGETTYRNRPDKGSELAIGRIKIDYYDAKNKVVHEVKKSDKLEKSHVAQVKYYLFVLHRHGIAGARGIIEYPTLRKTLQVAPLDEEDLAEVGAWEEKAFGIAHQEACPGLLPKKTICKSCSYFEFCYASES